MSEPGLSVQLMLLPLGELQSCAASKALPWAVLCGGVATSVMMGSLVHLGRRPDSRYSTSSPGWVWTVLFMRSLEPKDHRRGRTLLRVSLGLVGDLILTLLPWVPRTNGLASNPFVSAHLAGSSPNTGSSGDSGACVVPGGPGLGPPDTKLSLLLPPVSRTNQWSEVDELVEPVTEELADQGGMVFLL